MIPLTDDELSALPPNAAAEIRHHREHVTRLQTHNSKLTETNRKVSAMKTIKQWSKAVYDLAAAKGWHDNDDTTPIAQRVASYLMNLHSEVSEAWEAYRAGKLEAPCDKAEKMIAMGIRPLTCIEEELADVVIRVMDDAEALGIDLEAAIEAKHAYNASRSHRHGGKLA